MQKDILNFLQNDQWKLEGGMIVPAYLTKYMLSALDVAGVVYTTHNEVLGKRYTQKELEDDLSKLSVADCIIATSMFLTVQLFFQGETSQKVLNVLQSYPNKILFFETQLF